MDLVSSEEQALFSTASFKMPAEWAVHDGCWMGFPFWEENWHSKAGPAQKCFAEVANAIVQFEPMTVCAPTEQWSRARELLDPRVRVIEMGQNDGWFRDQAPIFVVDSSEKKEGEKNIIGLCWKFNAWGGLYDDFELDALVSRKICELERMKSVAINMVLEGGSVHVDGEGTLLTTTQCLLEENFVHRKRNPDLSKERIEEALKLYFGCKKVLWVPHGVENDYDTNEHVDNMCCFLRPGVVALHWAPEDENEKQYKYSEAAMSYLLSSTDAAGRSLNVVKICAPRNIIRTKEECFQLSPDTDRKEGEVLPASYINFYLPNGGVIVPQYGDKERDAAAVSIFKQEFPDRKVVPVMTKEILLGGGNIHCITMQQPRP
eukprot:m.107064 g.107064  ORF g.107064 m.107064 type:complete len:375 (-) comp13909_c0_seq5:1970-3094(-)